DWYAAFICVCVRARWPRTPLCRCRRSSFGRSAAPLALPSFPTRRSSDLLVPGRRRARACDSTLSPRALPPRAGQMPPRARFPPRSEEHTSELQSRFDLVCRLLLEKKNDNLHSTLPPQLRSTNFYLAPVLT